VEFETDDRTVVAGAEALVGLARGAVLGGRYEVRERLRDDAFTLDYRALDRRTQDAVRLREVRPGLLADGSAVLEVIEGLQEVLGVGGAFLPGLLDVGQEGPHVYVVEPWVAGTCLADVFERRASQGRTLQPKELLPVVARIDAALSVIPEKWHHGDVRARQVWLDAGELALTGAYLLDAMPTGAVAMVLQTQPGLRTYFAPEVAEGWAASAADRYGVAAIFWQGLLGEPPPAAGHASSAVRRLGALGDVLAQFLSPDPTDRPGSLAPLVQAFARAAERPAPDVDPVPFRPSRPPTMRKRRRDTIPVPPPSFDPGARQRPPGPAPVPAELRTPSAPAPVDDEWDAMPTQQFDRSMAAMLGEVTDPEGRPSPRTARGAPAQDEEMELGLEDLQSEPSRPAAQRQAAPQQAAPRQAARPAQVPVPAGIKPMPRPQPWTAVGPPRPSSPSEPAVVVRPSTHLPAPPPEGAAASMPTARTSRRPPARAKVASSRSVWVVLFAFAAAAAIVLGSLLFAQQQQREAELEKQQRIQQRLEQLRQETEAAEAAQTNEGPSPTSP
jgi:serine/threonine protein kinase